MLGMQLHLYAEVQVPNCPSLSWAEFVWAEFVMGRVVQLPICVLCLATLLTLVLDRKKLCGVQVHLIA